MTSAVISMGSNMGDSLVLLQRAVDMMVATEGIVPVAVSSVHRTAPVGPVQDQPEFSNIVLLVETTLTPLQLLERGLAIEDELGRRRVVPGGPRLIDVDLVQHGGATSDTERLVLPHPRAHERGFVLVPWLEVDPGAVLLGHGPVAELVDGLGQDGVRATSERIEL